MTSDRKVIFLLGAGVSLPDESGLGVPSTGAIVNAIEQRLGTSFTVTSSYQDAFDQIIAKRGQDAANAVIRESVIQARTDTALVTPRLKKMALADIAELELENNKWHIPIGILSVASLCAHFPKHFGRTILTTNFDPLIEVALSRQLTPWFSNALHADGSLLYLRGVGTHIVHLHGHWCDSDTLHTSTQLLAKRPQLTASIESLLSNSTVVVIGYGGWEDVFMTTLKNILEKNNANVDILWGFYESDANKISTNYSHVLEMLQPAISRGRGHLYLGISANSTLPNIFNTTVNITPAEDIPTFLPRVEMTRSGFVHYPGLGMPWGDPKASLGDYLKLLSRIDERKALEAALFAVEYLLAELERQPVHSAPIDSDYKWIREAIMKSRELINENENDKIWLSGAVLDINKHINEDNTLTSKDKTTLIASSNVICACLAYVNSGKFSPNPNTNFEDSLSVSVWVAKSIHAAARTVHDDDSALWGYLTRRISGGYDHLSRFSI